MSLLKTEILFHDEKADRLNYPQQLIWATHYLDLDSIVGFGEFYIDSDLLRDVTEVTIRGTGSRIINIPLELFLEVYEEYNDLEKDILNNLEHNRFII